MAGKFPEPFKCAYILIVGVYAFVLARFGLENWDTGYIISFSHRILNGAHPYSDFIYKGPPLTLYFHALMLKLIPQNGEFFFLKSANFLMFGLQVYLVVSGTFRHFPSLKENINPWLVMILSFSLSVLDFPGFPWPTTDGLLFASAAFYMMTSKTKPTNASLLAIAVFSVLSAFTKQSFYPIPLVFALWMLAAHGRRKFISLIVAQTITAGILILVIHQSSGIDNFIDQTTGETRISDMIMTGGTNYLFMFLRPEVFMPVVIVCGICLIRLRRLPYFSELLRCLSVAILIAAIGFALTRNVPDASRLAFVACSFEAIRKLYFKQIPLNRVLPVLALLAIAWCASISLGYNYPVFFFTGIICSTLILFPLDRRFRIIKTGLPVLLFGVSVTYAVKPYREDFIFRMNRSLSDVSPKLNHIQTTDYTVDKWLELKHLINKYGTRYIVAPSMPMAHYVFDTQSPLPADWIINSEVDRRYEDFIEMASDEKNYIFLEKSFVDGTENQPDFSIIATRIHQTFRKIDETQHFIIYNSTD